MPLIGLIKQYGHKKDKRRFRRETAVTKGIIELKVLILG